MPPSPVRVDSAAACRARSRTVSSNLLRGTASSTSFQSTAVRPFIPSGLVAKTSARSRRTFRLSTTRVRPPVPGSTPSSGTSGSETAAERSSTSRMRSQASVIS